MHLLRGECMLFLRCRLFCGVCYVTRKRALRAQRSAAQPGLLVEQAPKNKCHLRCRLFFRSLFTLYQRLIAVLKKVK